MLPAIIQSRCDSKSDKENTEDDHKFILSPATVLEQGLRNIASVQAYNLEEKFSKDYKSSLGAITTKAQPSEWYSRGRVLSCSEPSEKTVLPGGTLKGA